MFQCILHSCRRGHHWHKAVYGSHTNIKLSNIWIMEETEYSFQIVKLSLCQEGAVKKQPERNGGRTLVSIHSDRSDISIIVCLTESCCFWLFTLVNAYDCYQKHQLGIYISQNTRWHVSRFSVLQVTGWMNISRFKDVTPQPKGHFHVKCDWAEALYKIWGSKCKTFKWNFQTFLDFHPIDGATFYCLKYNLLTMWLKLVIASCKWESELHSKCGRTK